MVAEVVVCAAQSVVRAGLTAMVQSTGAEVVTQFGGLAALEDWLRSHQTDLAIVEMSLASVDDFNRLLTLLEEMSETFSESPPADEELFFVLLLETADGLNSTVQPFLVQLISSGRVSLLSANVLAEELEGAIAAITNGLTVVHPDFFEYLFNSPSAVLDSVDVELESLTQREIQVLNQLVDGRSNRAIARALNISEHTVKFHVSAILSKLNVSSRTEAIAVGIRSGLVIL